MEHARSAVVRTLCFQAAWKYAPTLPELLLMADSGVQHLSQENFEENIVSEIAKLKSEGIAGENGGRIGLAEELPGILSDIRERDMLQARKRRRAVKVAKWLASLGGVRFVALANTTALGNARDQGDLDFYVIAKAGAIWATRLLGAGPFKLTGLLPTKERTRDAVCLSYFTSDDALNLAPHMLGGDDPYFRYWFLSLVPLFDDGVGEELWRANRRITARHPLARQWVLPPDISFHPALRLPWYFCGFLEPIARAFQVRWFPRAIREMMNRDTRVLVSDKALKFHVDDRRAEFRDKYSELCRKYQVTE